MTSSAPTSELCVVSLLADKTKQVDVQLPFQAPIAELMEDLVALLEQHQLVTRTTDPGQWTLQRVDGTYLTRSETLEEEGVKNGDLLALVQIEKVERFRPIIEDVIDAVADSTESAFEEFTARTARNAALTLLPLGGAAIATLGWLVRSIDNNIYVGFSLLLIALCAWCGTFLSYRNGQHQLSYSLAITTLPLFATAMAAVVPAARDASSTTAAHLFIASLAAIIFSILTLRLTGIGTAFHSAVIAFSALTTFAAAIGAYWSAAHGYQIFAALIVAGLILVAAAPNLTVLLADIPLPNLPAPGEDLLPADFADLYTPDNDERVNSKIKNFARRARSANKYLTGIIIAAVVAVGAGTVLMFTPNDYHYWRVQVPLAIFVVIILIFRGRAYTDRIQSLTFFIGGALVGITVAFQIISNLSTTLNGIIVLGILACGIALGAVGLMRLPGKRLTPPIRRMLELLDWALITLVVPLALWTMNVYSIARNR